jgi:hypothetical protein
MQCLFFIRLCSVTSMHPDGSLDFKLVGWLSYCCIPPPHYKALSLHFSAWSYLFFCFCMLFNSQWIQRSTVQAGKTEQYPPSIPNGHSDPPFKRARQSNTHLQFNSVSAQFISVQFQSPALPASQACTHNGPSCSFTVLAASRMVPAVKRECLTCLASRLLACQASDRNTRDEALACAAGAT